MNTSLCQLKDKLRIARAFAFAIGLSTSTLLAPQYLRAATPQAIDEKLDRIFVLTAIDASGNPVVLQPSDKSRAPSIYAAVSISGLAEIRKAAKASTTPQIETQIKLTPTTLNYFLNEWKKIRSRESGLNARILPDRQEQVTAVELLKQIGKTEKEALSEIGSDVPVFCPVPAIYAEDAKLTIHNRPTGSKFIPCSFSAEILHSLIKSSQNRAATALVPVPLWKLIQALKNESNAAVSSLEVLAHPTLLSGMQTARRFRQFTSGNFAGVTSP